MKYPKYSYRSEEELLHFEFTSEGPRGMVRKIVEYSKTRTENVYNLGFGDLDDRAQSIDDLSVTNNADSLKVLATVAATVYDFTARYPHAWILATGSTPARTRLYRMGVSKNIDEIRKDFEIFGYDSSGKWVKFVVGADYEAFLLTRKENLAMKTSEVKEPAIALDKKLDEFKGKVLFPEKLEKANQILAKSALPIPEGR